MFFIVAPIHFVFNLTKRIIWEFENVQMKISNLDILLDRKIRNVEKVIKKNARNIDIGWQSGLESSR